MDKKKLSKLKKKQDELFEKHCVATGMDHNEDRIAFIRDFAAYLETQNVTWPEFNSAMNKLRK